MQFAPEFELSSVFPSHTLCGAAPLSALSTTDCCMVFSVGDQLILTADMSFMEGHFIGDILEEGDDSSRTIDPNDSADMSRALPQGNRKRRDNPYCRRCGLK